MCRVPIVCTMPVRVELPGRHCWRIRIGLANTVFEHFKAWSKHPRR